MFADSRLIIGDNVEVYFLNSNSWSTANFGLLGSGELHFFDLGLTAAVPESVF